MKLTSLSFGRGREQNGLWELPWRRRTADRTNAARTIPFALERDSLCRIAGNVRGVRIDCRQGRLWLTQAGAAADVILVLQPVSAFAAEGQASLGSLTLPRGVARLQIHRRQTFTTPARIGMDLTDPDRNGTWEQWAFLVVWFCGVLSVWCCLKWVLSLP